MPEHLVRLRFRLPDDARIGEESGERVFRIEPIGDIRLVPSSSAATIAKATDLVIRCGPFNSQSEATRIGASLKTSLLLAAAPLHTGFDVGQDAQNFGFVVGPGASKPSVLTEYGKEWFRTQHNIAPDVRIENDRLGLTIIEAAGSTGFASIPISAYITRPFSAFESAIQRALLLVDRLSDKARLALEVYNSAHFERSLRARFLAFVTAVEILAERPPRLDAAQTLITQFVEMLNAAGLEEGNSQPMRSALEDLRRRSIGASCRTLIKEHGNADEARFFGKCYGARSQLVHDGTTEFDIPSSINGLDILIGRVLVSVAERAT